MGELRTKPKCKWKVSIVNCFWLASILLLACSIDRIANAQFVFGSNEKGEIGSIDFAGTCEEFVAWSSGAQAKKTFNTVGCVYVRVACCPEMTSCFRQSPKLESLWLGISPDGIDLSPGSIKELDGLASLKELRIYGKNSKAGEISHIHNLNALEVLDFGGGVQVNDLDLKAIGACEKLKSLSIECERIDDSKWLERLTHLESLSIDAKYIEDDLFQILPRLLELTNLTIAGIPFDEKNLAKLAETSGSKLEHLQLELKQANVIETVRNFPLLQSLSVTTSQSGQSDFEFLRSLPRLKILYTKGWGIAVENLINPQEFKELLEMRISDSNGLTLSHWYRAKR